MLYVVLLVFAALAFFGLRWSTRVRWAAIDTPTIPTGHAFPGRIEIHGRAQPGPGGAVISPLTSKPCVWWQAEIEKKVSSGKKTEWKTQKKATSTGALLVDDGSGPLFVELGDKAPSAPRMDVLGQSKLSDITGGQLLGFATTATLPPFPTDVSTETPGLLANLVGRIGSDAYSDSLNIRTADGDWRITERRIEPGDHLYALGHVRSLNDTLVMSRTHGELVVLMGDERRLLGRMRWIALGTFAALLALVSAMFSAFFGDASIEPIRWSGGGALFGATLTVLVLLVMHIVRVRNRIVAAREQVMMSWSMIDIASKKRTDLTQNLLATLQASMAHEREVLTHLASARDASSHATGAPTADHVRAADLAHNEALAALTGLRGFRESNAPLRSAANFEQLFDGLVHLENGVAASRAYYVDARTVFADRIGSFPDSLLVRFAGPIPAEFPSAV